MHNAETNEWFVLCEKSRSDGFDALAQPEKIWIVTRELIDSTENGGLISYFYNSGADRLSACLRALDVLEATSVKEQVTRLCKLFGDEVPSNLNERNAAIEQFDGKYDEELDEIDETLLPLLDDLDQRLGQFLIANKCISNR